MSAMPQLCEQQTPRPLSAVPAQVLAQEGWRAFYRGMVPSMLGILPYAGVDIAIFELLKERLLDEVGRNGTQGRWGHATALPNACVCARASLLPDQPPPSPPPLPCSAV